MLHLRVVTQHFEPETGTATGGTTEATSDDTADLVCRARQGEREACQVLATRIAPAVRAFARRRLGDRAAVEDFTQDVLVVFVEALQQGKIEDPSRAASFALGVCRNLARERAKIRDRRRDAVEKYGDFPVMTLPTEPVLLDRARLEDCVSLLTGKAQRVLRQSYFDEDSDAEIASAMDLTAANVRVIRHRSIAALRTCMETKDVTWEAGR